MGDPRPRPAKGKGDSERDRRSTGPDALPAPTDSDRPSDEPRERHERVELEHDVHGTPDTPV